MIQMLSKLDISMTTGCDVEISLHFVPLQTAKNSTCPSPPSGCLFEFLFPPNLTQHMPDMGIALHFILIQPCAVLQQMHPFRIHPMVPARRVLAQHISRQDPVARGVLDVDVQVQTVHGNHNVEVDLQIVRNALFHGEKVAFMAAIPATELREGQKDGDEEQEKGGVATGRAASGVGWLGFGWSKAG